MKRLTQRKESSHATLAARFSDLANVPFFAATLLLLPTACAPVEGTSVDAGKIQDAGPKPDTRIVDEHTWLRNATDNGGNTLLTPSAGEESQRAAVRLTPARYPFSVEAIRYVLSHGETGGVTCDARLAHSLHVFTSTATAPAPTPSVDIDVDVEAIDDSQLNSQGRIVIHNIVPPLLLNQGEHLIVSIELAGSHPNVMCLPVNSEEAYEGNRNYWSNAVTPPFNWVQLDSFGLNGSIIVAAFGKPIDT
jgi:hypothetical protein